MKPSKPSALNLETPSTPPPPPHYHRFGNGLGAGAVRDKQYLELGGLVSGEGIRHMNASLMLMVDLDLHD